MTFLHPAWLWLLLLGIPLLAMHARRRAPASTSGPGPGGAVRTIVLAGLRLIALALLVLALARPVVRRNDTRTTTVAVADLSASISDSDLIGMQEQIDQLAARRRPGESLKLVTFDRRAREETLPAQPLNVLRRSSGSATRPAGGNGSALAEGLDLAGLLIRDEGAGRVVLLSDGLETSGDAGAAAWRLSRRAIPLQTLSIGGPRSAEVVLESVALPSSEGIGASVELKATILASAAVSVTLEIEDRSTGEVARGERRLQAGRQTITVPIPLRAAGICSYTVRVRSAQDTLADNNELVAAIDVSSPIRVRVIEDNPAQAAGLALKALAGPAAEVSPLDAGEPGLGGLLADTDVLAVADVPAETISAQAQTAIRDAVTRGMGLLMTGGRRAFGPARFPNSPLAEVAPLRFSQGLERRDPSATLVIIIDTSGSMTGPRVSLAKEIARLALARLKPHDKAGIVEFYGSKRWAAPIQSAANAIDLQRALNRLNAGGGTVILPALDEAYYALQNVNTRSKHVLVLTDGGVETGAFEAIIRKMADHNITLSTVMVGPGAHSTFLASLAYWGRGRFYSAPDRLNLPEIIVKQPENSLSLPFIEETVRVLAGRQSRILDGLDLASCPSVSGYVESAARPTADSLLVSELGHPLLVKWQYGLGSVGAWTTQMGGEWAGDLMQWGSAGRLFSNVLRSLAGVRPERALRIEPTVTPGGLELEISSLIDVADEAAAPVEIAAKSAEAKGPATRTWEIDPYSPHRWNLKISDLKPGVYSLEARTRDGKLGGTAAAAVNSPREVPALSPDVKLLEDLARIAGPAARGVQPPPTRFHEIWPILAGLVVPILLLHVLIRRWPSRVSLSPGLAAVVGMLVLAASSPSTWAAPSTQPANAIGTPQDALAELTQALTVSDSAAADEVLAKAIRSCLSNEGTLDPLVEHLKGGAADSARGAWLLSVAAREAGDLAVAREALTRLGEREPKGFDVWAELARVEELLGDEKGALEHIRKALELPCSPEQRQALLIRAAALEQSLGLAHEAVESMDRAIKASPEPDGIRHVLSHYAGLLGMPDQAERYLVPSGQGKERFHDHLFRGLFLSKQNRDEEARREYEQAYAMAPLERDRKYALERVIASARRGGRLPQLAQEWLAAKDLSTDRLAALAALLGELGDWKQLLGLLNRPTTRPEARQLMQSADFQTQVISAALASADLEQAESAYLQLMERYPEQVQWRMSLARLWLLNGRREQARKLLTDEVARCEDPGALMGLADAASHLAMDEVAFAASDKAARAGLAAQIRAGLFQAGLVRQRGDGDKAMGLVRKLVAPARKDPKLLQSVADALERYGDKAEALNLLKELYQAAGAEDTLLQVAHLLEENQKYDEAYKLWSELWATTQVPARLRQAEDRMLDLASRTGNLADLVIQIEERIGAGTVSERELSLIIQIYSKAQDPVSAAEVLQEYAARSEDQTDMLKRLARIYLEGEQFGRCTRTLRRLVEVDPANGADYLQQMAIMAMERKQPLEARRVLAELRARAGNDELNDEFAAGVLDMTGQHEDASRAYQRVLNRHPDRIEVWLLWGNAMKACGKAERAVARFQVLVEDATEDDLFTVAVDGLLNLDAKPAALRSALRRVYARIAVSPEKVFLYQLASDLLEGLNEAERARSAIEQCVVVAGERRSALLRELMDGARSANRLNDQIEYGQSVLALADEQPPQVFLDLGEALLKQGQLHLAERVFARAALDGEYSAIQQRVATCYEEQNMPADADRIIRGLLISEPDSVPLLVRSASLSEQMGHQEQAFSQYYRAADLMLRRLPGFVQHEVASPPAASEKARNRIGQAANLDEVTAYFESAGNGLISTARSAALRARLEEDLLRRVEEELKSLGAQRRFMPRLSGNPRLERLARFLRQVAFSLHLPDLADQVDRKLLSRYPNDLELRRTVVNSRAEWGLHRRAAALGRAIATTASRPSSRSAAAATTLAASSPADAAHDADTETASAAAGLSIDLVISDFRLADLLIAADAVSSEVAYRLVPALMMEGRQDQARRVLACAQPPESEELSSQAARMMASSIALEDSGAMQRWLGLWLERSPQVRSPGDPTAAATSMARCVHLAWRALDPGQRFGLVERINRVLPRLDERNRIAAQFLQLAICGELQLPFDGLEDLAREAAKETELPAKKIVLLLEHLPADAQIEFLRAAIGSRRPENQRLALLDVVGGMSKPASPQLRDGVLQLLESTPERKLTASNIRFWPGNARQPELSLAIAERLLGKSPDAPVVLVAAAAARQNAGHYDEAMILAREALELLGAVRQISVEETLCIGTLLRIMRPAELEKYAKELGEQYEIEAPTPVQTYIRGLALEALGREGEAVGAFRQACEAQPGNRVFSRKLITCLKNAGRTVELIRTLAGTLTSNSTMEAFEWRSLSDAYFNLFDPISAMQASRKDETIMGPVGQMRCARAVGKDDEALAIFRRFFIRNRDKGQFFEPYWADDPSPGGLAEFDAQRLGLTRKRRLFEAMADLPFAEDEYSALLQAARPERRDIPGLISGLVKVAGLTQGWDRLAGKLDSAQQADAMTVKDDMLLVALAAQHSEAVSGRLLASLDDARAHLDPTDSKLLFALAGVYEARGRTTDAKNLLQWILAAGLERQPVVSPVDRLKQLDAYLRVLPEADRVPQLRRWLGLFQPTGLDPLADEYGLECVDRLRAAGDAGWQEQLELLRKIADEQGGSSGFGQLRIDLARRYAELGNLPAFSGQLKNVLRASTPDELFLRSFDPREALPGDGNPAVLLQYVDVLQSLVQEGYQDGSIPRDHLVRILCLLAEWSREHKLTERAAAILEACEPHLLEPDNAWLFVADVYRRVGNEAKAAEIETKMLNADLLPVARIPGLLGQIEAAQGQARADELAVRVASYSSHPEVLKRAIRHCSASGDRKAALEFRKRLDQVMPGGKPTAGSTGSSAD